MRTRWPAAGAAGWTSPGCCEIVEHAADGVPGTLRNERSIAGIVGGTGRARGSRTGTGDRAVDVRLG
jgi:hypothetical protein